MSILGFATPAISPIFVGAILLALSGALAGALGVFRPRAVVGPDRMRRETPAWPLIAALGFGFIAWFMTQVMFITYKGPQFGPGGKPIPFDQNNLSVADWAFLASVAPLAGFIALWVTDVAFHGFTLLDELGFSRRRIVRGVSMGLIGALIILPPTYAVASLTEVFYNRIQFSHPTEHALLKAMGESPSPISRWILIVAAAVLAPFFEEFLFRGHLQTLIRRAIVALSGGLEATAAPQWGQGFPVTLSESPAVDPPPIPPIAPPPKPGVWQTWLAIIITSCLFALVHDKWMWPIIFFLSLGLGYCYERTGNLWTSITVHCLFNSTSTLVYLYQLHT